VRGADIVKRFHRVRGDDGAVAVEFALVLIPLFLLVFGVIEFGITYSKYESYLGAAREGARYASVQCEKQATGGCAAGDISGRVASTAGSFPVGPAAGPSGTAPTANIACSDSTVGQVVTVSWQQPIKISIPFWKVTTINPTISGSFRCE
jgi:Flp pilus assembly protein TadG